MAAHRCTDADQIVLFSGQQTRDRGGGVLAEIADLKDFFARFVADLDVFSAIHNVGNGCRGNARFARNVVDGHLFFCGRGPFCAFLIAEFLADCKNPFPRLLGNFDVLSVADDIGNGGGGHSRTFGDLCDRDIVFSVFMFHMNILLYFVENVNAVIDLSASIIFRIIFAEGIDNEKICDIIYLSD